MTKIVPFATKSGFPYVKYEGEAPEDKLLIVRYVDEDGSDSYVFGYKSSKTKLVFTVPDGLCLDELGKVDSYCLFYGVDGKTISLDAS